MTPDARARWERLALWLEQQPHQAAARTAIPTEHDPLLAGSTRARTARMRAAVVHYHDGQWRLYPKWREALDRWAETEAGTAPAQGQGAEELEP